MKFCYMMTKDDRAFNYKNVENDFIGLFKITFLWSKNWRQRVETKNEKC